MTQQNYINGLIMSTEVKMDRLGDKMGNADGRSSRSSNCRGGCRGNFDIRTKFSAKKVFGSLPQAANE